jgi:hypothetical protein
VNGAVYAWWCLMLATTPDTWAELLAGEPVEPGRLDPKWLERAETLKLVRLDPTAITELFRHGVEVSA